MSEVTRIMSKELEHTKKVTVSLTNGDLMVYYNITEIGFSADDQSLLFLFRDGEADDIPSVIINTDNIAYIETTKDDKSNNSGGINKAS